MWSGEKRSLRRVNIAILIGKWAQSKSAPSTEWYHQTNTVLPGLIPIKSFETDGLGKPLTHEVVVIVDIARLLGCCQP